MIDESFQKLYTLYNRVLDQPPEKRVEYIEQHAANDQIKQKLLEYLDLEDQANSFFNDLFSDTIQPAKTDSVPEQIGPYHIIAPAGRGGMSTVYKARHESHSEDQFVALKVLRKGLDTEDILYRFHQERKLLAGLNHRSIAGLLDAGSTDEGRPWLAMEYVDGLPITDYCRKHKLGITARLKLFQQVCQVVHYAHQQLVIHRDLKPANIMVTEDGRVRLLDFGIAKIFEPDNPEHTTPGFKAMTPEYASPEQKLGQPLSTSTDQYSLGILLYKMLTGIRAEDVTPDTETCNSIEAVPPPKYPSSAISEEDYNVSFCEEELETTVEQLRKELQGDIDNIVLKCLQPDPDQRYTSLSGLIRDVDNYLEGQPVTARTPSIGYQARKFIYRNKIEVSLAAGFVLATLFLAAFALYYAFERDRFAQELEKERDHAEAVSSFMTSVFKYADPIDGDEIVADAEAMLDYAESEVYGNFDNRPARLSATFLKTLSTIRGNLGQYAQATRIAQDNLDFISEHQIDKALRYQVKINAAYAFKQEEKYDEIRELVSDLETNYAHLSSDNPRFHSELYYLKALLAHSSDYDFDKAISYQKKAIEYAEMAAASDLLARMYQNLSSYLRDNDQIELALEYLETAVDKGRIQYGERHPHTASMYQTLSGLYRRQDNYEQAVEYAKLSLEIREEQLGTEHPGVASSYNNLGNIYRELDRLDEARGALEKSLTIRETLYGKTNFRIPSALNSLGIIHRRMGEYEKAISYYQRALKINEQNYGYDHPQLTVTLNNLGVLHRRLENFDEGERYYRRALQIRKDTYGEDHSQTQRVYNNMERLFYERGRKHYENREWDMAARYLEKAYRIQAETLGDYDRAQRRLLFLADTYRFMGNPQQSIDVLEQALPAYTTAFEPDDYNLVQLQTALGIYQRYIGDYEAAHATFTELIDNIGMEPEDVGSHHAQAYSGKGYVEYDLGNYHDALDYQYKAYTIMSDSLNLYEQTVSGALNHLGKNYHQLGEYQKAVDYYNQALTIQADSLGSDISELYARISFNLGETYLSTENYPDALQYYQKALRVFEEDPKGVTMISEDDVLGRMALVYEQTGRPEKSQHYRERMATTQEPY